MATHRGDPKKYQRYRDAISQLVKAQGKDVDPVAFAAACLDTAGILHASGAILHGHDPDVIAHGGRSTYDEAFAAHVAGSKVYREPGQGSA